MPSSKEPCPKCGRLKAKTSKVCVLCRESYERTQEHRKRMSELFKNKPKPTLQGRKRPKEVKQKISDAWTPEMREAARMRGISNAESREWLIAIAESVSGELNPNFQGKGETTPYAPGWGRAYRRRIRLRSNGTCEQCGYCATYPLDLHHKDFSFDNHHPDNLSVLCRSCHKKVHGEHKRLLRK